MKISLIFISTLLTLSVFLPFLLFVYNGVKNTSKTKTLINSIIKNNGIIYTHNEIWRKTFIGISNDNIILTYINANLNEPTIISIALSEIKQCNIYKNYSKDKAIVLKSLDLEFIYKSSTKQNLFINFYNTNVDNSEDYELQRIEKWHQLILNATSFQASVKIAS
tara:strand:- start:143 stop:637 length:495 start_codon:yes stop_codon:yes gene_type:complete